MSKGASVSKRRSRKSSSANLPAETLARARREAGLEPAPEKEAPVEAELDMVEEAVDEPVMVAATPRRTESLSSAQRRKRRRERVANASELSQTEIAERLANPTRVVSTDELRQQYAYVIADLRSMGLLAGSLFAFLIVIALFINR